jgi:hypothetical protein
VQAVTQCRWARPGAAGTVDDSEALRHPAVTVCVDDDSDGDSTRRGAAAAVAGARPGGSRPGGVQTSRVTVPTVRTRISVDPRGGPARPG